MQVWSGWFDSWVTVTGVSKSGMFSFKLDGVGFESHTPLAWYVERGLVR